MTLARKAAAKEGRIVFTTKDTKLTKEENIFFRFNHYGYNSPQLAA